MASGNPFSVVSIVQSGIEETFAINLRNVTHAVFTKKPDDQLSGKVYFVGSDIPHELHPDEVDATPPRSCESVQNIQIYECAGSSTRYPYPPIGIGL